MIVRMAKERIEPTGRVISRAMHHTDVADLASRFLTFRHFLGDGDGWTGTPVDNVGDNKRQPVSVLSSADLGIALHQRLSELVASHRNVGLLLSGGIDSALIASYLPQGTPVFTIKFDAGGAFDETSSAESYASKLKLDFNRVIVEWSHYQAFGGSLTQFKQAPLHPVEVALHVAARTAKASGIETLIVGNGADTNFGGMDLLLGRDWTAAEFETRYTFVAPKEVLREPVSQSHIFAKYEENGIFDTQTFLREIHGYGILRAFQNAICSTGIRICAPYEDLQLGTSMDLARIRKGEPKYLLAELFRNRFSASSAPRKIPFVRPMDQWMKNWGGPRSGYFLGDIDLTALSGEQRWLIHALDLYFDEVGVGS